MANRQNSPFSAISFHEDRRPLTDSLRNFTMKPNFEQPRALVACERMTQLIRARLRSSAGFLSPPAPRGLDRPGPNFRVRFNPPTLLGPVLTGPFFLNDIARFVVSAAMRGSRPACRRALPCC